MPLKILVESGNYFSDNVNFGDLAIYQSIVSRLRNAFADCEIQWITRNADILKVVCSDILALELPEDRQSDDSPLSEYLRQQNDVEGDIAECYSVGTAAIADALRRCDIVLATGGGYFSESFMDHAWTVLDTLEAGVSLGKPAMILSCGFEPVAHPKLIDKMSAVLPKLAHIMCREPLLSPAVVRSFGVSAQSVTSVGDEAIEPAYDLRAAGLGSGLGLNLRQSDYARVGIGTLERLRENLTVIAGRLAAPFIGIPISMVGPSDPDAIRTLLRGVADSVDDGRDSRAPDDVMRRVNECRLVITGSYHAAVFALSQGVSVVALVASAHYRAKFRGLQAQFGNAGGRIVEFDRGDTGTSFVQAVEEGWRDADSVRPELLNAALRQIEETRASYDRLHDCATLGPGWRRPSRERVYRSSALSGRAAHAGTHANGSQRGSVDSHPAVELNESRQPQEMSPTTMPRLSAEEIEEFRTQGYLGPFTAYTASDMDRARSIIFDRVLPTPTQYCPFGLRVRHLDSRTVYDLCSSPEIIGRMASLYGPNLVLWNSNLFNKPPAEPGRPEEYPWHQDHYNWQMEPVLNISAWLAIGPATPENGCVEVIPGSHRQIVPPVMDKDAQFSLRFGGVASDPRYVDETKKVSLPLESGQFFLFNERLLHHSNPNRTSESRLGLAIRVTVPIVKVSEPFPCVLLRGEDGMGFNRYVDPPAGEPDAEWVASLPQGHAFAFDRPIPGKGWHLREQDGSSSFAWTGLEPTAWIDFRPVGPGDHVLRCEVLHHISQRALEDARITVNGVPVAIEASRSGDVVLMTAHVPQKTLQMRDDRVRIAFDGSELLRPCDLNSASGDKRTLGLGIRHVSLSQA